MSLGLRQNGPCLALDLGCFGLRWVPLVSSHAHECTWPGAAGLRGSSREGSHRRDLFTLPLRGKVFAPRLASKAVMVLYGLALCRDSAKNKKQGQGNGARNLGWGGSLAKVMVGAPALGGQEQAWGGSSDSLGGTQPRESLGGASPESVWPFFLPLSDGAAALAFFLTEGAELVSKGGQGVGFGGGTDIPHAFSAEISSCRISPSRESAPIQVSRCPVPYSTPQRDTINHQAPASACPDPPPPPKHPTEHSPQTRATEVLLWALR